MSLLHRRQKAECLQPLLGLLASTDGSEVGDDISHKNSLVDNRQHTKCLLPKLGHHASTRHHRPPPACAASGWSWRVKLASLHGGLPVTHPRGSSLLTTACMMWGCAYCQAPTKPTTRAHGGTSWHTLWPARHTCRDALLAPGMHTSTRAHLSPEPKLPRLLLPPRHSTTTLPWRSRCLPAHRGPASRQSAKLH